MRHFLSCSDLADFNLIKLRPVKSVTFSNVHFQPRLCKPHFPFLSGSHGNLRLITKKHFLVKKHQCIVCSDVLVKFLVKYNILYIIYYIYNIINPTAKWLASNITDVMRQEVIYKPAAFFKHKYILICIP